MNFLFASNPLLGHFLPMVPLIRAARAAGHQVIVATGADLRHAVRRHGFPLWLVGPRFAEVRAELLASASTDDLTEIEPRLRHTVLFAQPGVIRAWAIAFEAVRDLRVNVIATVGNDHDPARFGPLPGHIAVARYVPQALIMRQVDAVVFHGGSGTMLGSVGEGKPMVSLPMGADRFANSEQIVRTGAGLVVGPAQRTPESIRAAIEQVLGYPSYAASALALQAGVAALPSAEQVLTELVARVDQSRQRVA